LRFHRAYIDQHRPGAFAAYGGVETEILFGIGKGLLDTGQVGDVQNAICIET
jgi:hypothetical protein